MPTSKVAKRYANGLLEFSQETGTTGSLANEMQNIINVLESSKELSAIYDSPFIDSKKKIDISKEVFNGFSQSSMNFISLVIKQGRESHLKSIAKEYIRKVEVLNGIQRISLTSATQLSRETIDKILRESHLVDNAKSFDIKTKINPTILGGYILRVGDQQIDASVKTKLSNIKKEFELN